MLHHNSNKVDPSKSERTPSNELIISVSATDISIALTKDKHLVELHKEKNNIQF